MSKQEKKRQIKAALTKLLENPQQTIDTGITLMCGYYGYQTAKHIKGDPIAGGTIGMLGYKLATSEGGMPPASQLAGLAILGSIGLLAILPPMPSAGEIAESIKTWLWSLLPPTQQEYIEQRNKDIAAHNPVPAEMRIQAGLPAWICPSGYKLQMEGANAMCYWEGT